MNTTEIKKLLEKYYEGNTSVQEEKLLTDFFNSEEVDEEFLADKDMFMFYQSEREENDVELNEIEKLVLETIKKEEDKDRRQNQGRRIRPLFILSQVAAVAIVLILGYFMIDNVVPTKTKDTFSDPELAMLEAQKVFSILAETMNKGTSELAPMNAFSTASSELSKTNVIDKANKELEKVGELKKGINGINSIVETVIK